MGLWNRLFGTKTLASIVEPMHVEVDGRIASPDVVTSPVSPQVRGVLVQIAFYVRHLDRGWDVSNTSDAFLERKDREVFEHLDTRIFARPFVVACEGGEVLVPAHHVPIQFPGVDWGQPLERPLPPELAPILTSPAAQKGIVHVRELSLRSGEKVRLRATVAPTERIESDGYRSAESVRSFVVLPDRAPFVIEDRSLDPD